MHWQGTKDGRAALAVEQSVRVQAPRNAVRAARNVCREAVSRGELTPLYGGELTPLYE